MPIKNGEAIAPMAVVPATSPICSPLKCRPCPSHVPTVTYHPPQIKNSRKNIRASLLFICKFMMPLAN